LSEEDKFKFLICELINCPHPRILDEILTDGDYRQWVAYLEWKKKLADA
jgi:hypothetical protein